MSTNTAKKEEFGFINASLVNASHYCRRLAYLQFVHQEWKDTSDTVKGRRIHKRVDKQDGVLPSPENVKKMKQPLRVRSVTLSSEKLGLISKIDLLETKNSEVIPVEYKKGPQPAFERTKNVFTPEEVQLCVQSMVLNDCGYSCKQGMIYYAASEKRVPVEFTKDLVAQTKQAIMNLVNDISKNTAPEPLNDSSKCPKCSLVEICLPDEFHFLKKKNKKVRPISIESDTKLPVLCSISPGAGI